MSEILKIIDKEETQKNKTKKQNQKQKKQEQRKEQEKITKNEENRGIEDTVKGWELNDFAFKLGFL